VRPIVAELDVQSSPLIQSQLGAGKIPEEAEKRIKGQQPQFKDEDKYR